MLLDSGQTNCHNCHNVYKTSSIFKADPVESSDHTCKWHRPKPAPLSVALARLPAILSSRTWKRANVIHEHSSSSLGRLFSNSIVNAHLALMNRSFSSLGVSGPGFFKPGCNLQANRVLLCFNSFMNMTLKGSCHHDMLIPGLPEAIGNIVAHAGHHCHVPWRPLIQIQGSDPVSRLYKLHSLMRFTNCQS